MSTYVEYDNFERELDIINYYVEILRNRSKGSMGTVFQLDSKIEFLELNSLPSEIKIRCLIENPHLMHGLVEGILRVSYLHIEDSKRKRTEYVRLLQRLKNLVSQIYTLARFSGDSCLEDYIYALVTIELFILQIKVDKYKLSAETETRELKQYLEFMQRDVKKPKPANLFYPYAGDMIRPTTYGLI
jgi:hypothetical protein